MTRKTKEFNAKSVIKTFGLFILFYGLLIIPWPGLGSAYSVFYRSGSSFLFESFGTEGNVRFHKSNHPEYDLLVTFFDLTDPDRKGRAKPFQQFCLTSRYSAYIYTSFLAALILASPISWKRRGMAMFWGMTLIHCYLAFKMAVMVLFTFGNTPDSPIVFGPVFKKTLFWAQTLMKNNIFSFIISAFIWFLVSFRKEDLDKILAWKGD